MSDANKQPSKFNTETDSGNRKSAYRYLAMSVLGGTLGALAAGSGVILTLGAGVMAGTAMAIMEKDKFFPQFASKSGEDAPT